MASPTWGAMLATRPTTGVWEGMGEVHAGGACMLIKGGVRGEEPLPLMQLVGVLQGVTLHLLMSPFDDR